ncbi:MAG: histidinol dehydrogenase [Candidatus Altiarchaeum hamiconexum]|uniref:Histidinol dehydrogenase n=1 Tax=Candidatus Altarchaeum hamiconexum TaxID=1803513 RepID=A0A8J7YWF8_9ARCH|nr:histidinol dehydrogenase [Candidatus Altarchaeum hamiconexum]OIQ06253.1 MAG: histidinol dehydrogenase [Candidatus Altarchaeum sp. CG2_30_32_3053]PIN67196.1 MAG: histidinol dehydrogenase [Candidatus Altarchaeum sp. CG12_big_fil_rev_8_21_14_0_65_33_22]NCN69328.1 histidinol dehydrogenase [Candidatus Altarchaeum hamiconexum]NCS91944.1 histidinol dehydrogenase [Candidatus Altarchaeum hamiconexum]
MATVNIYKWNELGGEEKAKILNRSEIEIEEVMQKAKEILKDVKENGDDAIVKYCKKFDCVDLEPSDFKVSEYEIKEAYKNIDKNLLKAIKRANRNIKNFHAAQIPKDIEIEIERGVIAGRRTLPLESAGLYVPGGKAVYPSVMLMLSAPAKVAKVNNIIACTPARTKNLDPATIAAADLNNVTLYKIGGIQAIAAMAYGTETISKTDVIAGPGNPYVSAAQRIVATDAGVKISFPPGPSEGVVIADEFANSKFCAADMISEAEHGPDSAGIFVTYSERLAKEVRVHTELMIEKLPDVRKHYIEENLKKYSGIVLLNNLQQAIDFVNEYAPEHLVVACRNPRRLMRRIKNAGTICLGKWTPITAGNFMVGSNAILPTGKYGKIFSGISVDTFLKFPTYEILTRKGLKRIRNDLNLFCDFEGFPGHKNSVNVRF